MGKFEYGVLCLGTADEAGGVDEGAAGDAGDGAEGVVAETSPGLGKLLAGVEAGGVGRDGGYAPAVAAVGEKHKEDLAGSAVVGLDLEEVLLPGNKAVEQEDAAALVEGVSGGKGVDDVLLGLEEGVAHVGEVVEEGVADELGRLLELSVEVVVGGVGLPARVEVGDHAGEGEVAVLEPRGQRVLLGVHVDAVVVGVDGLDEVCVDLVVEVVDLRCVGGNRLVERDHRRNHLAAKVLVHQPGRGELRAVLVVERRRKLSLVVVEVLGAVVLAADVHDDIGRVPVGWVSRPNELGVSVLGEQAEHVNRERLVRVEGA